MRHFEELFHARTGQELASARRWRIETSLRPLLKARALDSLDRLAGAVAGDAGLADAVVDALLNNETSFYRDGATFRRIDTQLFALFAKARAESRRLRIWCAGCSTGQEAYSVAMMIAAAPERWQGWRIDLLATDLSVRAIAQARDGLYSAFEIQRGLPVGDMVRWFEPNGENWRARAGLRARIVFGHHNLLDLPPAGMRADIVLCRNVMLYLGPERQRTLFANLASAMAADGVLMLGAGETAIGHGDLFAPDETMRGIYRRA